MKDVKFVIRFVGIPVKFIRKIPVTMADLTEKQYLSLVKYMNGQIREYRLITVMYNLPFFLLFTISRKKFWTYKLIESMEAFSDFSKPADRFFITRLPGTELSCDSRKFKGISFMQFMFADTMYTQYLKTNNEQYLYSFIAAFYLQPGENFATLDLELRTVYLEKKGINNVIYEAVFLNYMMLKKWLSVAYPYMFASNEDNGSSSPKRQQKWLDIFDAFVGEQIPDTEYYKNMPCMDAFRIINRRMKDYLNGPK